MSLEYRPEQLLNCFRAKYSNKKPILRYQPTTLQFLVSDRCTLNCNMCIRTQNNSPYKHKLLQDLTLETFKKVINRFPKAVRVNLVGLGEPFLAPDIFKIIKYSRSNRMKVSSISNGTILGDKIDAIFDSGLNRLSISLNTNDRDEFAAITNTRPEIFDSVVENVKELVKARRNKNSLELRSSFICTKSNYRKIPEMIEFVRDLGIEFLDLINLIPQENDDYSIDECLFVEDNEVVTFLNNLSRKSYSPLKVNFPTLISRNPANAKRKCHWYFNSIRIDSQGNVSSCGRVITPKPEYGNIFEDNDVWNNPHFQTMRKMFLNSDGDLLNCCQYCVESYR